MVTGFVSMCILTDESGYIPAGIFPFDEGRGMKQGIQPGDKCLVTSQQVNEPIHIVGDKPAPLPGVSLHVGGGFVIRMPGAKGAEPGAVAVPASHKAA